MLPVVPVVEVGLVIEPGWEPDWAPEVPLVEPDDCPLMSLVVPVVPVAPVAVPVVSGVPVVLVPVDDCPLVSLVDPVEPVAGLVALAPLGEVLF